MKAWHFVGETLRDGRAIPADGELLIHDGTLAMCAKGLHCSKRLIDALGYAPGDTICRVEYGGRRLYDTDKLVATERTILWRVDAGGLLYKFARLCALDVIDNWNAPETVIEWLKTGNEDLRSAARSAAYSADYSAARSAARQKQNNRLVQMVMHEKRRQYGC
jgi:hypothetical protein